MSGLGYLLAIISLSVNLSIGKNTHIVFFPTQRPAESGQVRTIRQTTNNHKICSTCLLRW